MKTKILLSLVLACFCSSALATRVAVKPRVGKQGVTNGGVVHAFRSQSLVRETEGCSGQCASKASAILSSDAVRTVNETPSQSLAKSTFLREAPPVFEALVAVKQGTAKRSFRKSAINKGIQVKGQVEREMAAIARAVKQSVGWSQEEQQNLMTFVRGISDGVSEEEKIKVNDVVENC